MKKFGFVLIAAILGGSVTLISYKAFFEEPVVKQYISPDSSTSVRTTSSIPSDMDTDFVTAAERTVHAVVHVKTAYEARSSQRFHSPLEEFFFGIPRERGPRILRGSGSGVIISPDGYIVTNNHVIEKAEEIEITTNDGTKYEAEIVGTDPATDIALLKIDAGDLPSLSFSSSDNLQVGEWVLAVGNPFNLTSTVTAGIISATGRDIGIIDDRSAIESFIQTDAAVNPGNSGGALVNTRGELIGINTAISSRSGSFEGYSFAVPGSIAKKVVEDILEYGVVQRAFIGVNIQDINAQLREEKDIDRTRGVYVAGVMEDGAAKEAGIEEGDIIVGVDGQEIKNSSQLREYVGRKRPGDQVTVSLLRNGKQKRYELVLRNMEGTTDIIEKEDLELVSLMGAKIEPLSPEEKEELNIPHGVKVVELRTGKLRSAGVPKGFIITRVNNRFIRSVEDMKVALSKVSSGDGIMVQGFYPNGRPGIFAFRK